MYRQRMFVFFSGNSHSYLTQLLAVSYTVASSRNQTRLRSIRVDTSFDLAHHTARTFQ